MSLAHNHHHETHGSLTTRAAIASVSMALFLLALKLFAAAETGSVALLGSLADTGFDVLASLLTLFSVRYAARPADDSHRFGHGKAEALSALIQVVLIIVSAILIGWRAMLRLGSGETTAHPEYGIGVSIIAIVATLALLAYQRQIVRKTGSVAIHADHVHYQSDLLLNIAVIVAILCETVLRIRGADPVFGIGIALWLLWGAFRAAQMALDQLLDREWPEEKRKQFIEVAMRHPQLRGIHDMRTRSSGVHDFCQFHVWVDPDMTILQAHRIMDEVEEALMQEFPGVEVLIHPDPEGHKDELGYVPSETIEHQDHNHD
ncbi:MAG: cation diffusion facilitator family transporter [Sphingorhabdus sp.]|uniref:cation diffusion facilitator family transporter n=1 Tax=Sphingorhabdus sp. TaxID=1902408 RepID=UPI0038FC4DC8